MRSSLAGLALATAAASIVIQDPPRAHRDGSIPFPFDPGPVPNDLGPVTDSTKESKRARRRRLARERKSHD